MSRQPRPNPTEENYSELSEAYDLFNDKLFDGELPGCLITLQRKKRSMGYFSPERFVNRDGIKVDEIALNPSYFATRPVEDVLSTLAHEMCHQRRFRRGETPRRCYHDRGWSAKMEEIGLIPSNTGAPGGKKTGEQMSHYIDASGKFIKVCKELLGSSFGIVWFDRFPVQTTKDYSYASNIEIAMPGELPEDDSGDDDDVQLIDLSGADPQPGPTPRANAPSSVSTLPQRRTNSPLKVPMLSTTPFSAGLDVARPEQSGAGGKSADSSNRVKYHCDGCKANLWGRAKLQVICGGCKRPYRQV